MTTEHKITTTPDTRGLFVHGCLGNGRVVKLIEQIVVEKYRNSNNRFL